MKTKLILLTLSLAALCLNPAHAAEKPLTLKTATKQTKTVTPEHQAGAFLASFSGLHLANYGKLITTVPDKPTSAASFQSFLAGLSDQWNVQKVTIHTDLGNLFSLTLTRTKHEQGSPSLIYVTGITGAETKLMESVIANHTAKLVLKDGALTMLIDGQQPYEVIGHEVIEKITANFGPDGSIKKTTQVILQKKMDLHVPVQKTDEVVTLTKTDLVVPVKKTTVAAPATFGSGS